MLFCIGIAFPQQSVVDFALFAQTLRIHIQGIRQ